MTATGASALPDNTLVHIDVSGRGYPVTAHFPLKWWVQLPGKLRQHLAGQYGPGAAGSQGASKAIYDCQHYLGQQILRGTRKLGDSPKESQAIAEGRAKWWVRQRFGQHYRKQLRAQAFAVDLTREFPEVCRAFGGGDLGRAPSAEDAYLRDVDPYKGAPFWSVDPDRLTALVQAALNEGCTSTERRVLAWSYMDEDTLTQKEQAEKLDCSTRWIRKYQLSGKTAVAAWLSAFYVNKPVAETAEDAAILAYLTS